MNKRRHTKLVREGPYYAAEVDGSSASRPFRGERRANKAA